MDTHNEQPITNPETDPRVTLRSDLWTTMNVTELARQQEICIDRINKLYSIMGAGGSQSMANIYHALQIANQELTNLINTRSQTKVKGRHGKG